MSNYDLITFFALVTAFLYLLFFSVLSIRGLRWQLKDVDERVSKLERSRMTTHAIRLPELAPDPDLSILRVPNSCRFCGCTEETPCTIAITKDREGNYLIAFDRTMTAIVEPCAWYLPGVCNAPACIEKLLKESRQNG